MGESIAKIEFALRATVEWVRQYVLVTDEARQRGVVIKRGIGARWLRDDRFLTLARTSRMARARSR